MEEQNKAGMTPAQRAEHERRKAAWRERERIKEEQRHREEQEQIERTRRMMASDEKYDVIIIGVCKICKMDR